MRLTGKIALVMGGGRSIGRAIAVEFAEQGAYTVVNSRPGPEAPGVVTELQARGFTVSWVPGDMGVPETARSVVNQVVARYGRLDVMVVSGSPSIPDPLLFAETDPAHYAHIVHSHLISRMCCLHAALEPMNAQKKGKVIFITTDAGRVPTPGESVIGAAGAGLLFFARAAGRELARKGIRINCIATTITRDTDAYDHFKAKLESGDVLARAFARVEARTPFRMNVPADIAQAAVYLASDESDQVSGAVISVNGGISFP